MISITKISGYDETSDILLLLAKQFRENKNCKTAYAKTMNVVTPRILKNNAIDAGRRNAASKQKETNNDYQN